MAFKSWRVDSFSSSEPPALLSISCQIRFGSCGAMFEDPRLATQPTHTSYPKLLLVGARKAHTLLHDKWFIKHVSHTLKRHLLPSPTLLDLVRRRTIPGRVWKVWTGKAFPASLQILIDGGEERSLSWDLQPFIMEREVIHEKAILSKLLVSFACAEIKVRQTPAKLRINVRRLSVSQTNQMIIGFVTYPLQWGAFLFPETDLGLTVKFN